MSVTADPSQIVSLNDAPTQSDSEIENRLTEEIQSLWTAHQETKNASKRSKDELKAIRSELAEKLHAIKALLVRTGRGGGWAAYLRSTKLARATADRWVAMHEAAVNPSPEKRLNEAISEPTEEAIRRLVHSLLPRLRRILTTREWVDWFAEEVAHQLVMGERSPVDRQSLAGRRRSELAPSA